MTAAEKHICEDTDEDYVVCIEGEVFGYCDSEFCTGGCDPQGKCYCKCHDEEKNAEDHPT